MKRNWFVDRESEFKEISHLVKRTVYETRSAFQHIKIIETYNHGLVLVLDEKIQSSESDEYIYHEGLVHPSMVVHENPSKVLILGGGEGATLREVLRHSTVREVVMVDIDEVLVNTCKTYLSNWQDGAFEDPRTRLVIMDAIEYVQNADETFDVVICDINDPVEGGPAARIYTREFYESVKEIMSQDGVFVTQAVEIFYDERDLHSVVNRSIASVFKVAESYCEYIPSFGAMWGFVLGSDRSSARQLSSEQIQSRLESGGVEALRFYDAETHFRMFRLPKMIRDAIRNQTRISTQKEPLNVFPG